MQIWKWSLFHFNVPSCDRDATTYICAATVFSLNELAHECKTSTSDWRASLKSTFAEDSVPTQISGALHSTTTSALNLRQLPAVNGSAFPEYPKQTQRLLEVYTRFSKIYPRWFSFHSALLPELTESWGESKMIPREKLTGGHDPCTYGYLCQASFYMICPLSRYPDGGPD